MHRPRRRQQLLPRLDHFHEVGPGLVDVVLAQCHLCAIFVATQDELIDATQHRPDASIAFRLGVNRELDKSILQAVAVLQIITHLVAVGDSVTRRYPILKQNGKTPLNSLKLQDAPVCLSV